MEAEPHQIGKGTVWIQCRHIARVGRYDSSRSGLVLLSPRPYLASRSLSRTIFVSFTSAVHCCLRCRIFAGHQGARRFDRRCSASFRIGVLVRVLCPVANTFSLADASVVDGDCRVAAIPEAIRQNYHNCWGCDLNRGLSLVLRVVLPPRSHAAAAKFVTVARQTSAAHGRSRMLVRPAGLSLRSTPFARRIDRAH